MSPAFISYSRKNSRQAEFLFRALTEIGAQPFLDRDGIALGEGWMERIGAAISECEFFVLLVTNDSLDSKNVREEFGFAHVLKKTIIPIMLEVVDPGKLGRLFPITALQQVELYEWDLDRDDPKWVAAFQLLQRLLQQPAGRTMKPDPLQGFKQRGITQIYASRKDAEQDIAADLVRDDVTRINIIGISLNDFTDGQNGILHDAWRKVRSYIKGDSRPLEIRILLTHPESLGSHLRARAEEREQPGPLDQSRLKRHVLETVTEIKYLREEAEKLAVSNHRRPRVTLECKLYFGAPILFLCQTDTVSYVQQYYYWRGRQDNPGAPILKCVKAANPGIDHGMHTELEAHFDWIWNNDIASITAEAWLDAHVVGIESGAYSTGMVNFFNNFDSQVDVYTDQNQARSRIQYLMENAETRLWIMGISLHSFFNQQPSNDLLLTINALAERGKADIRILMIDPESEQARYRSYRESLFRLDEDIGLDEFAKSHYEAQRLFQDTRTTIETIKRLSNKYAKVNGKLYSSAPACFILMVDDSVIVEQYIYGINGIRGVVPRILGRQMPVMEYRRVPPEIFRFDPERAAYILLEDHFEFVWDHYSRDLP
ncbi:MAG: toll/interleukin-1 receptor domain-containing protein [Anaerolineae bacterium]|nr:toll/interleukin-1 receptor domain-containing protein [Anaerolineae bacterium]